MGLGKKKLLPKVPYTNFRYSVSENVGLVLRVTRSSATLGHVLAKPLSYRMSADPAPPAVERESAPRRQQRCTELTASTIGKTLPNYPSLEASPKSAVHKNHHERKTAPKINICSKPDRTGNKPGKHTHTTHD